MTTAALSLHWAESNPDMVVLSGVVENNPAFTHYHPEQYIHGLAEELSSIVQGGTQEPIFPESLFVKHYLGFIGIDNLFYGLCCVLDRMSKHRAGEEVVDSFYQVDIGCKDTFMITHG